MVSIVRAPTPALAPFVETLWYLDEALPAGSELSVPTGSMQLVVNLGDDVVHWHDGDLFQTVHRAHGAGLCGAIARPVGIDTADQRRSVGAAFRPGGAVPFFHPPADVLAEPVIGLDALWGRDGATLRERLLCQPSPDAVLRTLEQVLLERVVRPDMMRQSEAVAYNALHAGDRSAPSSAVAGPGAAAPRGADRAVEYAVRALSTGAAVGEVVDRLGTTPSTFSRRFRTAVGLNPKPFARVRRLQRVLREVSAANQVAGSGGSGGAATHGTSWADAGTRWEARSGSADRSVSWADVAVRHGYFDQAHLTNEFRTLTGVTPGTYRARSPEEQNHVPLTE